MFFIQKCLPRVLKAGCTLAWQQEEKFKRQKLEIQPGQVIGVEGNEGSLGRIRQGISLRVLWAGRRAALQLESKVKVKNEDNKLSKSRRGPVNLAPEPKAG